jgi:hydroxymethylpyrimidine/phosphomethylpyrimidine kinase
MVAKGGASLLAEPAVGALKSLLVPRAALLTPNAPEAAALTGLTVETTDDLRRAGEALLELGAHAVLMKGGHVATSERGSERVVDLLITRQGETAFEGERIDTRHTHGTGCTLASACATGLAQGLTLTESVARAWNYVHEAMLRAPGFGAGHGPLDHGWVVRGEGGRSCGPPSSGRWPWPPESNPERPGSPPRRHHPRRADHDAGAADRQDPRPGPARRAWSSPAPSTSRSGTT